MDNIELLRQKSNLLQAFLVKTKEINQKLDDVENIAQLDSIERLVEDRQEIIDSINQLNKSLAAIDLVQAGSAYKKELDDNTWLWHKSLQEIEQLEKDNAATMTGLKKGYEKKVKSTKDTIRVIDAYSKQMMEEPSSIDKRK